MEKKNKGGRPKHGSPSKKSTPVRIPDELLDRLEQAGNGKPIRELVRHAVEEFVTILVP